MATDVSTILAKPAITTVMGEGISGAEIIPGQLLIQKTTGKYHPHDVVGGNCELLVAFERELLGKGVEEVIPANTRFQFLQARSGDELYMILEDGENVGIGDLLVSNGNGNLKKLVDVDIDSSAATGTVYPASIIGSAQEALDLSDSSSAESSSATVGLDKRIKVRIR